MIKTTLIILLSSLLFGINAQNSHILKGYIKDKETHEALIEATVYNSDTRKGTTTNNYGFFNINVGKGKESILFSYVGYTPQIIDFVLLADSMVNIYLVPYQLIDEVIIVGNYSNKINISQTSIEMISIKTINSLPVLLGEPDILKSIQLLPGVIAGTEGSSGYYVRGGTSDQNLILIDGVPVYNAYHLYGFFSVFNPDAINSATLYKGGIPARYGGRLSSV